MIHTTPRLYLRKRDGSPAEPLNAATFHQIGRTIHDIIMDLQSLQIANSIKSERYSRGIIHAEVQGATHALHQINELLERVQDAPLPYTCTRCHGKNPDCDRCGGTGLVEERQR